MLHQGRSGTASDGSGSGETEPRGRPSAIRPRQRYPRRPVRSRRPTMRTRHLPLASLLLLAAGSCSPMGAHIGDPMQPQESVRLAVVDAAPSQYFEKTVLVEATVKAVCQNKGCWMQVEDAGHV